MKKTILASTMVLGLVLGSLGMASKSNAAVPTVSAGAAQSITLPVSTVTLVGTATFSAPATAIASYAWVQTSGPVASVIATPASASTSVTGLTTAGSYVFTLTATDNAPAPAFVGTSTVTVTVNPALIPLPPVFNNSKMKLEINPQGKVELQGKLESITGNILVVKVWGLSFTVNAANAKFGSLAQDFTLYKIGDIVKVQGAMDATALTPTVIARKISDENIRNLRDRKGREDERKHENENRRSDGNMFPSLDDHNQKGKGDDNNKGRGSDDR
ncbi:MAG: hypothetical protein AAB477_03310 [Patescibacteria group bacterium]